MSKNLIWLNVGGEKFCTRKRLEKKSIIWYHKKTIRIIFNMNIGIFGNTQLGNINLETRLLTW